MTAIVWDRLEDRRFETGIERGVIYPVGGSAQAWNGLVSVVESPGRDAKVYYQDGVKTLVRLIAPGYKAKITAFTYPEVLDELQGNQRIASGVNLHDQREGKFHLAYRTKIGTALEGVDYGYKLHLIYDLVVNPSDVTHETISDQPAAASFEWDVEGAQRIWNTQLVNHISIDSRLADPAVLGSIETQLYGTDSSEPGMPDPFDLLNSFSG
jgi:hypothetical protein